MPDLITMEVPERVHDALRALKGPDEDLDAFIRRLATAARESGFYANPAEVGRGIGEELPEPKAELALSRDAYDALLALRGGDEEVGPLLLRLTTAARTSALFDPVADVVRREPAKSDAPGGMDLRDSFVIPKEEGRAFEVHAGERLRIVEIEGAQTCDFNAFVLPDFGERFSAGRTRFFTGAHPRKGDHLWSNPPHERPLFTIVEDTVGENDVLFPRCSRIVFEPFGVKDHRGCQDLLQEAIGPWGLTPNDVHDTFNAFMHTGVDADGYIYIKPPSALRGDYLDLVCHVDCLVALSSCPAGDVHATNGGQNKALGVEIYSPSS